jgi:Flp pilus assembly protein TadG
MIATDFDNRIAPQRRTRRDRVTAARRRAADANGAALVEFALVLPVVLLVLFGIIQFGLALNSANDETHLANEVARYVTVNQDPSSESLQKWAKRQVDSNALSAQKVCISFPSGATVGNPVEVKVYGTIKWLPLLKLKSASTVVEGKAFMRLEAEPTAPVKAGCE